MAEYCACVCGWVQQPTWWNQHLFLNQHLCRGVDGVMSASTPAGSGSISMKTPVCEPVEAVLDSFCCLIKCIAVTDVSSPSRECHQTRPTAFSLTTVRVKGSSSCSLNICYLSSNTWEMLQRWCATSVGGGQDRTKTLTGTHLCWVDENFSPEAQHSRCKHCTRSSSNQLVHRSQQL